MPQVVSPVELEPQVVVGMYHLMSQGILKLALAVHGIRAYLNSVLWIKPSTLPSRTSPTIYILRRYIASKLSDVVLKEPYNRAYTTEEPYQ